MRLHVDRTVVLHLLKPHRIGAIDPGVHSIDLREACCIHRRVEANVIIEIGRATSQAWSFKMQRLIYIDGTENDAKHGKANYSTTRSIIQAAQVIHDAKSPFSRYQLGN